MKIFHLLLFSCMATAWAQMPPQPMPPPQLPNVPDDTVVAIMDGQKISMAEFKKYFVVMPQELQQLWARDPQDFWKSYGLMGKLAKMAEEEKLDQSSPTKESLEYYRKAILAPAKLNATLMGMEVAPSEIIEAYNVNKDKKYKQVKFKAIYIAFSKEPGTKADGKKRLTEQEAEAKANRLLTEIRGGADFVKLVKAESDDETSRDANGDFPTLRQSDNVPDAIKNAVFSLKKGETAGPVRQANGFYLLRAEDVSARPLSQVRDEILNDLKNEKYQKWLEGITPKVEIPKLSAPAAAPAPAK